MLRPRSGPGSGRLVALEHNRPQPHAKDAHPWHLANRNKRGTTLDLKSPSASQVLEKLVKWADVLIVNTPHPARKKLKLEYDDVVRWNPRLIYADVTGFGEKGPDADLPGFDITLYWARSGLLSMTRDAGAPRAKVVGFDIIFPTLAGQSKIPFDGEMLGARLRGFDRDFLRVLAIGARAEKVVFGGGAAARTPDRVLGTALGMR